MNLDIKIATRESYGDEIAKLGEKNSKIVVLDADLAEATKTSIFKKKFPDRFLDMGIAEQDMMGTAAGMATCGFIPFASTFAVFATGRAYDQIRNSICYPNLNVKICATHSGVAVGEDGATHQMLEDLGLMRGLPNMIVLSVSDDKQTRWAIREASNIKGPVYIRLGRLEAPVIYEEEQTFRIGKSVQFGEGEDASIIATGQMVSEALLAKEQLEKEGVHIRVVDMYSIKPIDREMIVKCAKETKHVITIEDHSIIGGLGTAVCETLSEEYPCKVIRLGMKDTFGKSGKAELLLSYFGLSKDGIIKQVRECMS